MLLASPTSYTVDLTSATGAGSGTAGDIAYVINQANANTNPAGSLIQFDPAVFNTPHIITLVHTLELSETSGPEVIDGPGASPVTISGDNAFQVLQVDSNVTATLAGLTISGDVTNGGGGGINNMGTLTVTDSTIAWNTVRHGGNGGGIDNENSMTLTGCTVFNNSVSALGGYAGGINNHGSMTVTNSTISHNSGVFAGGGILNDGSLSVTGSTVASNSVVGGGGGISNDSILVVTDSTIAGNRAGGGGGGILSTGGGMLTAVNTTIADNTVGSLGTGGGLSVQGGTTTLDNTIIALNTHDSPSAGGAGVADDIGASGHGTVFQACADNLIGTGGSGGLTNGTNGNQVGITNPGLGPLANNGGPTKTIALDWGSPAINAGSNALDAGQSTDQRGAGYARISGGTVDIGAYERQIIPLIVVVNQILVHWGIAGLEPVQIAGDGINLLPAGRKTDLPWIGMNSFQFGFSQPVFLTPADVTVQSVRGINYGPITVSGSGTTYNIKFAQPIDKADRVTLTVNIAGAEAFSGRLNVLPGDVNGDGVVNSKDVTVLRKDLRGKGSAQSLIFGDLLGNGAVNSSDSNAAKKRFGTKLPKLPKLGGKPPKATLARALLRQHPGVKHHG